MTTFQRAVLAYVQAHPECTGMDVAVAFKAERSMLYGWQRPTSAAIAYLRFRGYLEDVARRCEHCGSALTRRSKNVPLLITERGLEELGLVEGILKPQRLF